MTYEMRDRSPRLESRFALLILVPLLTLGLAQSAAALSFNAFLTRVDAGMAPAIGAAQLDYDGATGMLRIDTTALGVTPSPLSAAPYSLRIAELTVALGRASDWLALPNGRGMGSHLEIDPCVGAVSPSFCRSSLMHGLMTQGAVLQLATPYDGGSISGVVQMSAVPEPGTGILAALGLAGLAAYSRKRR